MSGSINVSEVLADDARRYFEHLVRHLSESGKDDLIFHPIDDFHTWAPEERIEKYKERWAKELPSPGSEKAWVAKIDSEIVGHLDLRPIGPAAANHRVVLGMGIERHARGHGVGRRLMNEAISWAKASGFAWIDLYVFAHNEPARKLYRTCGFKEIGTTEDLFRIQGKKIDDLHMALKL